MNKKEFPRTTNLCCYSTWFNFCLIKIDLFL